MKQKSVQFNIRVQPKLLEKLKRRAKNEELSINQEAARRIELSFLYENIFGDIDKFSLGLDRRIWAIQAALQNIHLILEKDAETAQKYFRHTSQDEIKKKAPLDPSKETGIFKPKVSLE